MAIKVGDIVRGNSNHINPHRRNDVGVITQMSGDDIYWVKWSESTQAAYGSELDLVVPVLTYHKANQEE